MDNARADKLIGLLEQLVEVLKPQPETLPTFEQAVEARVKNLYLKKGIDEVFDKINSGDESYRAVRDLLNRRAAGVTTQTLKAIDKVAGDEQYTEDVHGIERKNKLIALQERLEASQRGRDESECKRIEKEIAELENTL